MFTTAPDTLVAIKLDFTTYNKTACKINDIRPAGREYIIDERLPENKLLSKTLTTRQKAPYFIPHKIKQSRINKFDMPSLARKIADVAIGYCDASRLFARPRRNEYALMCEDEDGKFWFHVDKSFFDKLLEI